MVRILTALEFVVTEEGDQLSALVPTWRGDVTVMPDIAEEVARIYNYDNIALYNSGSRIIPLVV